MSRCFVMWSIILTFDVLTAAAEPTMTNSETEMKEKLMFKPIT